MFDRNQWIILAQGATASGAILAGVFAQNVLRQVFDLPDHTLAERLAFAIHWLLLPGLMLLIGILAMASGRFFGDAVDGTRTPKAHRLEINLRYNLNTLEQTFLAAIAWLGLSVMLPYPQLVLIPYFSVLFVIGRVCFWVGYLINPVARGFGMLLTFLPTVGSFLWLLLHFFK